jgi:uncharacterized protein YyaL (SSP411 family)
VLQSTGLAVRVDPSEGAYPSGLSSMSRAAHALYLLTGERRYERAAREGMRLVAAQAVQVPSAFGTALALMSELAGEVEQLVIVLPVAGASSALTAAARRRPAPLVAVATQGQADAFAAEGFELYDGRRARDGLPTAYLCRDFVCRLPVTDPAAL